MISGLYVIGTLLLKIEMMLIMIYFPDFVQLVKYIFSPQQHPGLNRVFLCYCEDLKSEIAGIICIIVHLFNHKHCLKHFTNISNLYPEFHSPVQSHWQIKSQLLSSHLDSAVNLSLLCKLGKCFPSQSPADCREALTLQPFLLPNNHLLTLNKLSQLWSISA